MLKETKTHNKIHTNTITAINIPIIIIIGNLLLKARINEMNINNMIGYNGIELN